MRTRDLVFGAVGTLFGAVSLTYPFGRDQGLFYYAAREWLDRGQVLYRDVWDHKPPVIYIIHMLTIAVFGEHQWGIRVAELFIGVPLLAWVTARLATPRSEPLRDGVFGAAWLAVAVAYYGYLGFWDTAQCELWAVLLATAGLAAALRIRDRVRGAIVAGVLSALALFTKPPVVLFVLLCGGAVAMRAREGAGTRLRSALTSLGAWALGGVAPAALILGYFAARHALAPMLDILVGANAVYVRDEPTVRGVGLVTVLMLGNFGTMQPFSTLVVLGTAAAIFAGRSVRDGSLARRYLLSAALVACAAGAVLLQRKFYAYHWGLEASAAGVFGAALFSDMDDVAALSRRGRWFAPASLLAMTLALFAVSGSPFMTWLASVQKAVAYLGGGLSREEFSRNFDIPGFYQNHDVEIVGRWLRDHARPGDTLVVRGFEPEIYAWSGLHYTGRFYWTPFLTLSTRVYRREQYLREDRAAILADPPRWAVTQDGPVATLDSTAWMRQFRYRRRGTVGGFSILEHVR